MSCLLRTTVGSVGVCRSLMFLSDHQVVQKCGVLAARGFDVRCPDSGKATGNLLSEMGFYQEWGSTLNPKPSACNGREGEREREREGQRERRTEREGQREKDREREREREKDRERERERERESERVRE